MNVPLNDCNCLNMECLLGKLINMPQLERNGFLSLTLTSLQVSNSFPNVKYDLQFIRDVILLREKFDYFDSNEIILLEDYFADNPLDSNISFETTDHTLPFPSSSFMKALPTELLYGEPLFAKPPLKISDYTPFIGIILNPINGLRIFVESRGISRCQQGNPYFIGSDRHFILHKAQSLTIKQYIKAMSEKYPRLGKDYSENHKVLELHMLKIGNKWSSNLARSTYILHRNKEAGVFSYTSMLEDYSTSDMEQKKSRILAVGHSIIPLTVPVHIGCYWEAGSSFPGGNYKSIIEAAKKTNLCVYVILYRVFSSAEEFETWYIIQDLKESYKDRERFSVKSSMTISK